jgi:hypothetical protein
MVINSSGNVGIGTTAPANPLHIYSGVASPLQLQQSGTAPNYITFKSNGTVYGYFGFDNDAGGGLFGSNTAYGMAFGTPTATNINIATSNIVRMTVTAAGNVGIGITNPTIPLHVSGYTQSVAGVVYYFNGTGSGINNGSLTNISIFASNGIQAGDYVGARSDRRIKKNIQPLTNALDKLCQIEVVSYDKIDFTAKGSDCGVIAQNIKEVLPRAVTIMTDYLPNIYAIATHIKDDDTVRVTVVFTENIIKINVKVKLYVVRDEVQIAYEVVVIDHDNVSITVKPWDKYDASDRVFVYGVEHDDIMSVEKDQIGILAAAGVKELHQIIQQQQTVIISLLTRLSEAGF